MRITTVFVTHDQEEALELADRIVVMNEGRVEQIGAPADVYRAPASPFVSEFLGDINRIECWIEDGQVHAADGRTPLGTVDGRNGPGVIYVRQHDVELVPLAKPLHDGGLVRHVYEVGPIVRAEVEYAGMLLDVVLPESEQIKRPVHAGDHVEIGIRRGLVFPKDTTGNADAMRLVPVRALGAQRG